MIHTVELLWRRSLNGYRIREPSEEEEAEWMKYAATQPEMPPLPAEVNPASRITPIGSDLVPYYLSKYLSETKINIVEEFANVIPEQICMFTNYFGPLRKLKLAPAEKLAAEGSEAEWSEYYNSQWQYEQPLGDWILAQFEIRTMLEQAKANEFEPIEEKFLVHDLGRPAVRLIRQRGHDRPQLQLEPGSLLSYIVLQAAIFIAGGASIRTCRECSNLMIVGGGSQGYSNRELCSHRCRMAAYRREKKKKLAKRQLNP